MESKAKTKITQGDRKARCGFEWQGRLLAALLLCALLAFWHVTALGENIDLVTLPSREGVQLTIYNSADLTLAKETRFLSIKNGMNKVQFSWAGTLIDPSSVNFRPIEHGEEVRLVDTVFSGTKAQSLIWNIESSFEGQVRVEVSYFTSGITWRMDYTATCNLDETNMDFKGYVSVFNNSGEDYDNAEIRLIVGKINLVETIAELAKQRGLEQVDHLEEDERTVLKNDAVWGLMNRAQDAGDKPSNSMQAKEKKIVKEGMSEYFMFSVEGTESIPHGWTKRMKALEADAIPFDIIYRMRDYQYGPAPVRFFIWNNDEEHKLGDSPIPDGVVNILKQSGREGMSFLGRQLVNYVPIKGDIEINLGSDDQVVYEANKATTARDNFSFRRSGWEEYVEGWRETTAWADHIRNYRAKPIKFELRRIWDGDVAYSADIAGKLFDYRTVETIFTVETRVSRTLSARVISQMGALSKQSRVEIK